MYLRKNKRIYERLWGEVMENIKMIIKYETEVKKLLKELKAKKH